MPAKKRAAPAPPKDYYPLFNKFPSEIHAMILERCNPIDRVCMQLTWYFPSSYPFSTRKTNPPSSKYLYNLLPRPSQPLSLSTSEAPIPICAKSQEPPYGKCINRHGCHQSSLDVVNARRAEKGLWPLGKQKWCSTWWSLDHCFCFSNKSTQVLHKQLRSWVPREWKFCSRCNRYTFRKRTKKYLCQHGFKAPSGPSMRAYYERRTYWTHHRGKGAFGHKLWKKWFNNAAYDRMEMRLQGKLQASDYGLEGDEREGVVAEEV
ncbi:f-box domain-containing protein [Rutstroemia sp. NJR-2017a BBW]|nr:f-box domain-containing protein [Rutstroemia sp. NJR-2017a BBW]